MLYDGQTFDHNGHTFKVEFPPDSDHGAPWEEYDGHGVVSKWTTREKRSHERILATDRSSYRYYDVRASLDLARKDSWGTHDGQQPGETIRAYRARAVDADYEFLRRWCADEWRYVGVVVTLLGDDDEPTTERESLWGIEDFDPAYLETVARELADEIIGRVEVDEPDIVLSEN